MHTDLRKIWVVGSTEFGTSVRTKSFLIGVLFMPLITGLSIALQAFTAGRVDNRTRTFAVIDNTGVLYPAIEASLRTYNEQAIDNQGKLSRPMLSLEKVDATIQGPAASLELSDRIRAGSSTLMPSFRRRPSSLRPPTGTGLSRSSITRTTRTTTSSATG